MRISSVQQEYWSGLTKLADDPADEVDNQRNRDTGDADDVDDDTCVDHLSDGDIARCIDNGIGRCRYWQHETE